MFDPEDEFGMFYAGFEIPRNLIWCDRETLMRFPMGMRDGTRPQAWWMGCDYFEPQSTLTFFLSARSAGFRRGLQSAIESQLFCVQEGVSAYAFEELGRLFGVDRSLHECEGLFLEGVWRLDRRLVRSLLEARDDLEAVAMRWLERLLAAYRVEPVCQTFHRRRGKSYEYWWHEPQYPIDGFESQKIADILIDLVEVCRCRTRAEAVYVAVSR